MNAQINITDGTQITINNIPAVFHNGSFLTADNNVLVIGYNAKHEREVTLKNWYIAIREGQKSAQTLIAEMKRGTVFGKLVVELNYDVATHISPVSYEQTNRKMESVWANS